MIFGLGVTSSQVEAHSAVGFRFLYFHVRDKLYEHLVSHEVILKVLCIKMFFIRDMTYKHVLDKDMFMSFRNLIYMI